MQRGRRTVTHDSRWLGKKVARILRGWEWQLLFSTISRRGYGAVVGVMVNAGMGNVFYDGILNFHLFNL